MRVLSYTDAFQVLLLQAADDGRGPALFGDSLQRARTEAPPFLVGRRFPSVYLEHPLIGDPFLDVTVLYNDLEPGTRVSSDMAAGAEGLLAWFAEERPRFPDKDLCCGFELDTKDPRLPAAGVHLQPYSHTELVGPFCEAVGEPGRASLYLETARRMPKEWSLSFFGMFRGRPEAPLRVCGYLGPGEIKRCAADPRHLARRFDEIGFGAYDDAMLAQVAGFMATATKSADFQFDVFPDGTLGDVFAVDLQFGIEKPEAVRASFESGPAAATLGLLEEWGAADGRWRLAGDSAFARALPMEDGGGRPVLYAFTLMPHWVKARWAAGRLQPSKLYHYAHGGVLDDGDEDLGPRFGGGAV